ncbi:hypothetical protein AALO_G00095090 [Alosa alosa]|uniref:Uncharacterized protein n=1 Tax=Alosa alosa TaxID=278164 RepID=A0AAV6GXI4_9TELE|nr:hypothetical protein AALO_G00095090 [Alosa alosa]
MSYLFSAWTIVLVFALGHVGFATAARTVIVLVFALGHVGFATADDPCKQYTNISDPWRNRGFLLTSSQLQLKDDSDLQEGWYRFVGVGGDILDFASIPIPSLAEERLGYCSLRSYSPTVTNINLCAGAISNGSVDVKVCSSRYYVHKLRPTARNQIYATSHQRCTESSCGEFAQCGTLGACVCKTGCIRCPKDFYRQETHTDAEVRERDLENVRFMG